MKMRVTRAFNSDALKVLNLNSKKKSSLIDIISTLSELATKAATRGNILHGFYESGLIDQTKSRYPVLLKVLGTCRSMLPNEVYQSVIDNFTHLYRIMMEQCRIPEDVFDDLGFPHNKDVYKKCCELQVYRRKVISDQNVLLTNFKTGDALSFSTAAVCSVITS